MPGRNIPAQKEFGRRVRALRTDKGLTLETLGEASGLHWTYVGQVERGERNISLANILKLANALDVDTGTLMERLK